MSIRSEWIIKCIIIYLSVLLTSQMIGPSALSMEEDHAGSRLSGLITFDVSGTSVFSDGVDGWNFFVIGRVNTTTTIRSRLQNTGDTPLKNVEVTCTAYWYDGFYPDRGAVMFKDVAFVDIPPGDGSLSEYFDFNWVPTFAGAYMLNISAHVPGDAREMSTEPLFFQGLRYEPIPNSYFYTGVWVATEYWDGSSMEEWERFSIDAPPDEGWGSVEHPLALNGSNYHSTPYCFWAGNRTTWNITGTGVHSLITPRMDLSRFDPDPYDVERNTRRPQIYFMYRYRGELTRNDTTGQGTLSHYVSLDDGSTWEPLLDIKDDHIRIFGKTSGESWRYTTRPAYVGEEEMVGIDLGRYQGETIRIRMDMDLSGKNETGLLLDDVTLIGMDLVESMPFTIEPSDPGNIRADPGSQIDFSLKIVPKRTIDPFTVRLQCVNTSGMIDPDNNIEITPPIATFDEHSSDPLNVRITLSLPDNERSGTGWIIVRVAGGGITRETRFDFRINPSHLIVSSISTDRDPPLECDGSQSMELSMRNAGNIAESVHYTFVSDPDIDWGPGRGIVHLEPGEEEIISGTLTNTEDSLSGLKNGAIVVSLDPLPPDEEVYLAITQGTVESSWQIHSINCTIDQFRSVDIVALTGYREIKEPPQNGSRTIVYEMFIMNNGNGRDDVGLSMDGFGSLEGMETRYPSALTLEAGSSMVVNIFIDLEFPLPLGRYAFNFSVTGFDDTVLKTVEIVLVLGSRPISSGTYFENGSLVFEPADVIRGMETILSFSTQTFGYPPDERFTIGLLIDDLEVSTFKFPHSLGEYDNYQITWSFDKEGERNVTLVIYHDEGPDSPSLGLLKSINRSIQVKYIDLYVSGIRLGDISSEGGQMEIDPGSYNIEAIIWNTGDIDANIIMVTLEIWEINSISNRSIQSVNLSNVGLGQENIVQFKPVRFLEQRNYRIKVSIDNKDRWTEDEENDVMSISLVVGESPPDEPLWRKPWFPFAIIGGSLVITAVWFLYLIRKKL